MTPKCHSNDSKMTLEWQDEGEGSKRRRRRRQFGDEIDVGVGWKWNGVGRSASAHGPISWRLPSDVDVTQRRRWRRYVDGGTEDAASARRRRGHRRRAGGGGGRGRRRGASTVLPPDGGGGGGARHQPSIQLNSPTPKWERKCQLQKSLHVDWLNELKETWQRWMKLKYFNSYRILKEVDGAAATGNERRRETDGERLISINLHKFASVGRDGNKRAIASFTGSFPSFTSQPFQQCSQIRRKSNSITKIQRNWINWRKIRLKFESFEWNCETLR